MKHVGYQNRIQAYQCGISPNTKILGFLVLLVYAFASAVAGSVGGIALIWGKPSRDGSGGIVVVAFSQCYSVFCLLDYIVSGVAAHSVVTSSPRFPVLALAFTLLLSPMFVAFPFFSSESTNIVVERIPK